VALNIYSSCPVDLLGETTTVLRVLGDYNINKYPGADPGFQVRGGGAHLRKLHRAEGGVKILGVFRVKNHNFTPKNHIFSIAEGGAKMFGVFRVKNHDFTPKNHIFSNFRGVFGNDSWISKILMNNTDALLRSSPLLV
jgi:hypothetical protein